MKNNKQFHVLFLDAYYPPENTADIHLEQDLISGMVDRGWKVDVLCPIPTRGCSEEEKRKYRKIKKEIQYSGNVTVWRFWAPQEGSKASLRALRYIWCCLRQAQLARRFKGIDIIYCNSTPPIQGLVARYIKRKLGGSFIYSLQDLFPDSLITAGIADKESKAYKIGLKIERKTYDACDEVITLSESMKDILLEKGIPADKIHVVYNWIDTDRVKPIKKEENKLFDELKIDREKFTVVYAGNFGKSQNIDYIIEAAKQLIGLDSIQFVLFGAGSEFERIKNRVSSEKISNTKIFPLMNSNRVAEVYSMGDIDIICNAPGISMIGMPSKTWTIMATETPIIAVIDQNSELSDIISNSLSGWTVSNINSTELSSKIESLIHERKQLTERGRFGREYASKMASRESAVNEYLKVILKASN